MEIIQEKMQKNFKPTVFWSWNHVIEPKEAARQVEEYAAAGIGGLFVHARNVGIPYLGEQWFACFDAVLAEAERLGIELWIYDENGWPSGFGNGVVNGVGKIFQMKRLREVSEGCGEIICEHDGKKIGVICESDYADLMDGDAVRFFIDTVHEQYKKRYADKFGKVIKGVFTDEPQLDNGGFPYSYKLDEFFLRECGYPLRENLWKLFTESFKHQQFKIDYFSCVGKLMRQSFTSQIEAWCRKNGLIFTGHFPCEESLCAQPSVTGGVQAHYKIMSQPGVDSLGRRYAPALLFKQLCSVKNIYDKERVLSESFAGVGNGVAFNDLLHLYAYQAAFGVNFLCIHLGAYTLSGIGKRDYPPAFSYQQPWWNDFGIFTKEAERINRFVSEGKAKNDVLVVSPLQTTACCSLYGAEQNRYSAAYRRVIENLIDAGIGFDIFDESFAADTVAENGRLIVKGKPYKIVILPPVHSLSPAICDLLRTFSPAGELLVIDELPKTAEGENQIGSFNYTLITNRFEPLVNYFNVRGAQGEISFLSESGERVRGIVSGMWHCGEVSNLLLLNRENYAEKLFFLKTKGINSVTRLMEQGNAELKSIVRYGNTYTKIRLKPGEYQTLKISHETKNPLNAEEEKPVSSRVYYPRVRRYAEENYLVVDKVYCSLDKCRELHLVDELRRLVTGHKKFTLRYAFKTEETEGITLLAEPYGGRMTVNGVAVSDCGERHIDRMIPEYRLDGVLKKGVNTVEIAYSVSGNEKGEEKLFETVGNSRAFSYTVENLILSGKFDVRTEAPKTELLNGYYYIEAKAGEYPFEIVSAGKGEKLFYRGDVAYEFGVEFPESGMSKLVVNGLTGTFADIYIDDKKVGSVYRQPFETEIASRAGKRKLTVLVRGNNRNIFGAFHSHHAEYVFTGRDTFDGAAASFEHYDVEKERKNFEFYAFLDFKIESVEIKTYQKV